MSEEDWMIVCAYHGTAFIDARILFAFNWCFGGASDWWRGGGGGGGMLLPLWAKGLKGFPLFVHILV